MLWPFVALAAFLDWVVRGLVNPSIPAQLFICLLLLVCVAQAVVIAVYWDARRPAEKLIPWHKRAIDWLKEFDEPIIIVTLLLAGATAGLWWATTDMVADAKHTAQQQLRAYVFLRDIRLQKRNDDWFDVVPEWENSGASETVNMTAHLSRLLTDIPLPEWFSYGDIGGGNDNVPIILGPKSVANIGFDAIHKSCLAQFNRRDDVQKFYIWGWAKYNDTETAEQHITRFCWDIDQAVFSPDGSTVRLSHKLCRRGNCADRQCPEPEHGQFQVRVYSCKQELIPPIEQVPPNPATRPPEKTE